MTAYADRIINRVRTINELLKTCEYERGKPVAFMAANPVKIDYDNNTKLLGNKHYERYTFQHGVKLLVTLTSNANCCYGVLREVELMSVLVDEDGEIINPMFHVLNTQELQEMAVMTLDALDMLVKYLTGEYKNEEVCSDSGKSTST